MSLRFTINNEAAGEYKTITENAPSSFTQPAGSGMRGDKSARATVVAGATTYGQLNLPTNSDTPAQMEPVCVGFHFKLASAGTWEDGNTVAMVHFYNGAVDAGHLKLVRAGGVTKLNIQITGAGAPGSYTDTQALTTGTEYYIRLVCNWTAGTMTLYIDDSERGTATAVPASAAKAPDRFYVGAHTTFNTPTIALDIDHFHIGDLLGDVIKTGIFEDLDNDDGEFGEYTTSLKAGSSTITQTALATHNGLYGLRAVLAADSDYAFGRKAFTETMIRGTSIYIGFWFKQNAAPHATGPMPIFLWNVALANIAFGYLYSTGKIAFACYKDDGNYTLTDQGALSSGWHYIIVGITRASSDVAADGGITFSIDGTTIDTLDDLDNFDRFVDLGRAHLGCSSGGKAGHIISIDETKFGSTAAEVAYETFTGYVFYRGVGDITDVDFDTEIARSTATTVSLVGLGHAASTRYTYACRPILADLETPDLSCTTEFVTAVDSDWVGNRAEPVRDAQAFIRPAGVIRIRWHYRTGTTAPDDFALWYATTKAGLGVGEPDTTETYTADGWFEHDFTLSDATAYWFRIVPRVGAVESEALTIGPFLADATAPDTPTLTAEATYRS